MAIVAGDLVLEVQEARPPNISMRDAARFAHFIRVKPDQQHPSDDRLHEFWRLYSENENPTHRYTRDQFLETFRSCERVRQETYKRACARWMKKRGIYLEALRAKNVSPDVEWRRRVAWDRRNPAPQTYNYRTVPVPMFCGECGLPWFGNHIYHAGALRNIGFDICWNCVATRYYRCTRCHHYVRNGEEHYHPPEPRRGSNCHAPQERFRMPNVHLLAGYQPSDRIVAIPAPASGQGKAVPMIAMRSIAEIVNAVAGKANSSYNYFGGRDIVLNAGSAEWETAAGKFPKRLANALYRNYQLKLPADKVSEIGNIAVQAMTEGQTHYVEFTRRLSGDATEYLNNASCWWSDGRYQRSRCLLKENGGMAMRLWEGLVPEKDYYRGFHNLIGRAWIIPVDSDLKSVVHDPMQAWGWILFNAYGKEGDYLNKSAGQQMAVILASVLGLEYVSSVSILCSGMFSNNKSDRLIASERVNATSISLYIQQDDTLPEKRQITCSCITHKHEPEQTYNYDDTNWTPRLLRDGPATTKYPEEIEEPDDDDRADDDIEVVAAAGRPIEDEEPDDDLLRAARIRGADFVANPIRRPRRAAAPLFQFEDDPDVE
jgi:hypothetical protein